MITHFHVTQSSTSFQVNQRHKDDDDGLSPHPYSTPPTSNYSSGQCANFSISFFSRRTVNLRDERHTFSSSLRQLAITHTHEMLRMVLESHRLKPIARDMGKKDVKIYATFYYGLYSKVAALIGL